MKNMNKNNNYYSNRPWGLAEAIVGVAAIYAVKEIVVETIKYLGIKKEEKK